LLSFSYLQPEISLGDGFLRQSTNNPNPDTINPIRGEPHNRNLSRSAVGQPVNGKPPKLVVGGQ
jgi:hypothetical protein